MKGREEMAQYFISDNAVIGDGCRFGHNVVVEDGVKLGNGVSLGHGVVVMKDTHLGDNTEVAPHAVIGKPPKGSASSKKKAGSGGLLMVGAGSTIGASAVVHSGNSFGENCYIGDLAAVREGNEFGEAVIIGRCVTVECENVLRNRVRVQTAAYLTGNMIIEDDVFIGPEVVTSNDRYMSMWKDKQYRGPVIEKGAAVGAGACLLAGITVGEHSVVGAGAVVVRDVPPGRIYVGIPAHDIGSVREV